MLACLQCVMVCVRDVGCTQTCPLLLCLVLPKQCRRVSDPFSICVLCVVVIFARMFFFSFFVDNDMRRGAIPSWLSLLEYAARDAFSMGPTGVTEKGILVWPQPSLRFFLLGNRTVLRPYSVGALCRRFRGGQSVRVGVDRRAKPGATCLFVLKPARTAV